MDDLSFGFHWRSARSRDGYLKSRLDQGFCFGTANSSDVCLGMPGSKQRRQRASYIPLAPTTIRSVDSTSRWVCLAGLPQRTQMASVLVIDSARQSNSGMGENGRPK